MKMTKEIFKPDAQMKKSIYDIKVERLRQSVGTIAYIRDHVLKGKMNKNLYDFINADGSLDNLFGNSPELFSGAAMEDLNSTRLLFAGVALNEQHAAMEGMFDKIIDVFKRWIENYWDRNRVLWNALRRHDADYSGRPDIFGGSDKFDKMTVNTYPCFEWKTMVAAAKKLSGIVNKIPEKDLKGWFDSNAKDIADGLKEFGFGVNADNKTITSGNPAHHKTVNTCRGHRYMFTQISSDCKLAISLLGEERDNRLAADKIIKLYKKASEDDMKYLTFTRRFVELTKTVCFIVASNYCGILNMAVRKNGGSKTAQK